MCLVLRGAQCQAFAFTPKCRLTRPSCPSRPSRPSRPAEKGFGDAIGCFVLGFWGVPTKPSKLLFFEEPCESCESCESCECGELGLFQRWGDVS